MNIPRHQLDEALRRVQQGMMQPDEAARWLLDQSAASTTTVAELMNQLGPPPEEIQRDWDEQFAQLAFAYQRIHGQRLSELTAHDILIDDENRLTLSPRILVADVLTSIQTDASSVDDDLHSSVVLTSSKTEELTKATGSRLNHNAEKKSRSLIAKHRWIAPASCFSVAIIVLGITFYLFTGNRSDDSSAPTVASNSKRTAATTSVFSPTVTNDVNTVDRNRIEPPALAAGSVGFVTSEAMPTVSAGGLKKSAQPTEKPVKSKATMGLDSFAGGNWVTASELLPTADFNADTVESEITATAPDAATPAPPDVVATAAAMNESRQPDDAANDSPTKQTIGPTSIALPPLPSRNATDESIQSVSIVDQAVDNLELLFPIETPLVLIKGNRSWTVQDKKDQSPLATFTTQDDCLQFRWAMIAATRPSAKQLSFGMLNSSFRDGTKRPIFLRPLVTADAWPIDFSTSDAKAAWLIGTAPLSAPSRLTVEFLMPEGVVQTWVQSSDPMHVTRHQSIVEFALDSDPSITIRSQLDIRTGTRVALRMRHALQLDPSQTWQLISTDRMQTALGQVTDQLARAVAQQTEIKTIYFKSSAAEKRVLAPQSNAISDVVLRLQTLNKRLTQYEQLMSQLEHTSHLIIRLDVNWPETAPQPIQPIFALVAPTASGG